MDIVQSFYDRLASRYDRLFSDWQAAAEEQAGILHHIFHDYGFGPSARILDCACGIGTQAVGLAARGYRVTASDISGGALSEAGERARKNGVEILFRRADFRALSEVFPEQFDIFIAMDNSLTLMLTAGDLKAAVGSIVGRVRPGGIFVASIRDYDRLLTDRPPCSLPYVHRTEKGQRVSFQTWLWEDEKYRLTQYIIEDEGDLQVSRFDCMYRAVRRDELKKLLLSGGCSEAVWMFPEETGFYQPIVVARK